MIYVITKNLKIRKEDRLLLLCTRNILSEEIQSEIISILQQKIDWDYLLERSSEHKLKPLLYNTLKYSFLSFVPGYVIENLKNFFQENVYKNLLLVGELLKVLKLLNSHNITAIPFKGPVLAVQAYDDLTLREFNDLDIFIQKDDFSKVRKLLVSIGYNSEFQLSNPKETKYVMSQREYRFFDKNLGLTLDVQWEVSALFFSLPKTIMLGEELVSIEINNFEIPVFSTEDLLLILCLHNAGHRWTRLAWLYDILQLINNNSVDWTMVVRKAGKLCIKRILLINLCLIRDLFEFEIPEEIKYYLKSDSSIQVIVKRIENNIFGENYEKSLLDEIYFNLRLRDNIYYGIKDAIRDAMYPTPLEWKKIDLPLIFYPFYYIYRPLSILMRYKLK